MGSSTSTAEKHLHIAATIGQPARYQTEAAIQSIHAGRAKTGITNHHAIAGLYDVLWRQAPSLGCGVACAVAWHHADDSKLGYELLGQLPFNEVENYQPFWAARAYIGAALKLIDIAITAYDKAIALSDQQPVKQFLAKQRQELISKNKN